MAKNWTITELKQKIEDDIPDEKARKSILKLFAKVIEKNYDINPSNWNVSYRTGGSGLRFQLNFGHKYVLGVYADSILVMNKRETFLKLPRDFISEILKECEFANDGTNKTANPTTVEELENYPPEELWHNSIQFKIPFSNCEKYLETLESAICDFAKWCTENRKKNPQSEDAHVSAFIDYLNQELETDIPQPEYFGEWNPDIEEQYWLIAPGENAKKWDEYSKSGEIGIGWEELGNIGKYDSDYDSLQNDYIKIYQSANDNYRGSSPKQIWDFYKNIEIGNIIFARKGVRQIVGMGKVISDYIYDDSRDEYKSIRKVEWKKIGEWNYPGQSSRDTVHNLKPEQAEEILTIMSNKMTGYEEKLDEIKENLEANKNVILTGAPGTGKTFMAKTVAARIILEREINDFDKDLTEEEKKQVESQTDFVQFHPSYDYTDFVEGLRPKHVDGSDQIGFERKDGVFKAFCEKALKESYRENSDNVDNFEECWKKLVDELNENDFVTIPLISGKGDFRVELNEYGTGLANRTYENDDYQKGKWIQGKSKFFSKDQLYNIYQGLPGTPAGGHDNYRKAVVEYMKKNLGLLDYRKTESTQKTKKNFVFIIDEINRGEVAKIFGELFYCVDPGYRGEKGRISTQYQNLVTSGEFQKGFFIPENVYIIGTMNDIDRSVESMDFAFRRRFSWIEVKASDTVDMLYPSTNENGESTGLESKELADEAKRRMDNLNAEISKIDGLNEAYHIGASYFLKLKNYAGDFESLWEYHIKGILQEYLRSNPNAQEELEKLKAAYDREEEK